MSKKMDESSSNNQKNSEMELEDILNYKFKERVSVSSELHQRIIESTSKKKNTRYNYWFAAAGITILISINVLSIRSYNKQVKNERLKEIYTEDWNNTNIF